MYSAKMKSGGGYDPLTGAPAPGWHGGDFDGSGGVNGDDYFIIDRGFLGGAPVGASSPVPEPSSVVLCVMSAALLLRRRS